MSYAFVGLGGGRVGEGVLYILIVVMWSVLLLSSTKFKISLSLPSLLNAITTVNTLQHRACMCELYVHDLNNHSHLFV